MKKIFYIIAIIFYCCSSVNSDVQKVMLDWRKDELGCLGLRQKIITDNLETITQEFLGKSNKSLDKRLGRANEILEETDGKLYNYFVVPGNQCLDNSFDDQIDVLRLAFKVKGDKVVDIYELQP